MNKFMYVLEGILYIPISELQQEGMSVMGFLDEEQRKYQAQYFLNIYNAEKHKNYRYAGMSGISDGKIAIKVE